MKVWARALVGSLPLFRDKKMVSERDSLCLRKPEVEVTHVQWLLFLQNKLRGICGEEGGQEGEATGEGELEWPATEQGDTGADRGPGWPLEGQAEVRP